MSAAPRPGVVKSDDARYALDLVKAICSHVGPGLPGSPQERQRAGMIEEGLEAHLGAGCVAVEEFIFAPAAFLRSSPIIALLALLAALLNLAAGRLTGVMPWPACIAALVISLIPPLVLVFEFVLGLELTDPLFKKGRSVNVAGSLRKPGAQSVKRLLILSGHHDSAPENTWLRFLGYGFFVLSATWFLGLLTLPAMCLVQLAGLVAGNTGLFEAGTLGWPLLVYPIAPSILFALFLSRGWEDGGTVPGAADNLSACGLMVAMCRYLVENPSYIPDDRDPLRLLWRRGSRLPGLAAVHGAPPGRAPAPGCAAAQPGGHCPPGDRHPDFRDERHREEFSGDGEQRGRRRRACRRPLQAQAGFPRRSRRCRSL